MEVDINFLIDDGCFKPWAGKALNKASLSQLSEQVSLLENAA